MGFIGAAGRVILLGSYRLEGGSDLFIAEEGGRRDEEGQEPPWCENGFLMNIWALKGSCEYILSVYELVCINNMLCIIGSVI